MSDIYGHKAFQNTQTGEVWVSKFVNDAPVTFVLSEETEAKLQCLFTKVREQVPQLLRATKNPEIVSINTCSNMADVSLFDEGTYILKGDIRLSRFQ